MSDTAILKVPGGWPPYEELEMNEEISKRFDRLDDTHGKMFDLLRDQAEKFNEHRTNSQVSRQNHELRLVALEANIERRSALKSGLTMAGIGAFFGALAAAIGKKTGLWTLLALMLLVGCGTPESLRETNYLNAEAARWIAEASPDPAIDRAAGSIAAGSEQIARKIGEPEVKPAYTPDVHDATVAKSKADLDAQEAVKRGIGGFFENIVTKGADLLWPGLGGTLIGAFFWLKKKLQFDKLKAGAQVVVRAAEKIPAVKEATAALASKLGVGKQVDDVVQNLLK